MHQSEAEHSCHVLVHHTVPSRTDLEASFARLQAFWHWFPSRPRSLQLACSTYSLFVDNLARELPKGLEIIRLWQYCLPLRWVNDTVPSSICSPLHKSNMSCNTRILCSPKQNIPNNTLWCKTISKYLGLLSTINPCHWLKVIKLLKYVCTESFHLLTPCTSACDHGCFYWQFHHSNHIQTIAHWSSEKWTKWLHQINESDLLQWLDYLRMSVNSHHGDGLQGRLGVYVYVFDALRIQNRRRKALGERQWFSTLRKDVLCIIYVQYNINVFTATAVA